MSSLRILWFTLSCCCLVGLRAQVYADQFEQIRVASSDLAIPNCIQQDSLGFFWIGAASGLYRYDGFELKKWSNQAGQVNTLTNNFIRDLFIDQEGNIWLMHRPGGLSIYRPAQDSFIDLSNWPFFPQSLIDNQYHDIIQDDQGRYWLASDKGLHCITEIDFERQVIAHHAYPQLTAESNSPPPGLIHNLLRVEQHLWIGGAGGVSRFDFQTENFRHYTFPEITDRRCYSLFEAADGSIIVFFQNQGYPWKLNPRAEEFEQLTSFETHASDKFFGIVDAKGDWWVAEAGYGLHHYDPINQEQRFYSSRFENAINIKGDYLEMPYLDREGNLWYCGGMDLQILRNTHKKIQNFALTHQGQNRTLGIWSNDSIVVAGQVFGGIVFIDLQSGSIERILAEDDPGTGLLDNRCSGMIPNGEGSLWVCGREALYSLDLETKEVELYAQRPDDIVRTVLADRQNRHWLLWTAGDLMLLNPATKQTEISFSELGTQYGAIDLHQGYVDQYDHLWLASINGGLLRVQPETNQIDQFLADSIVDPGGQTGRVNFVYPFSDSLLLIGTNAGIFSFDLVSNTFSNYLNTDNGLSSNTIRHIKQTNDSTLWVLTNFGLNRISLPELTVRTYFQEDGMQNNYYSTIYQSPSGKVVLSGQSGVSVIDESQLDNHPVPARVLIKDIKVWNQSLALDLAAPYLNTLELNHRQDFLSIELAAMHFQAPNRNEYAYRLVGLSDDWVQLGNRRNIDLVNLSPGYYTLELKAANNDGLWQVEPKRLQIYIRPAFWQTVWFRIAVGLLVLGIIVFFVRRRLRRYRQENELKDRIKALENQALNAQMNPHFLFNCLNSIKAYIGQSDVQTAQRYLQEFSQLIRRTLQHGRKERVRLQDEIELLQHYLNLEQFRFQPSFTYKIHIDQAVQADFLEIPPMLIHPYVENAIWHGLMHKESADRQLAIVIKRSGDWVIIQIKDNGIGRKMAAQLQTRTASKHQSLGMRITQDRLDNFPSFEGKSASVEIIDLSDHQGKATGTRVILQLPIPE